MYNSLFWSISPQDAVTQGGFLVDVSRRRYPSEGEAISPFVGGVTCMYFYRAASRMQVMLTGQPLSSGQVYRNTIIEFAEPPVNTTHSSPTVPPLLTYVPTITGMGAPEVELVPRFRSLYTYIYLNCVFHPYTSHCSRERCHFSLPGVPVRVMILLCPQLLNATQV